MLLNVRDEETGEGMDDRQLRDEVVTIMVAGHETTANALAWTWHLLGQHPDVEARLHAELAETLGDAVPIADDFPRLPFTRSIFEEALRLYPPVWLFDRLAVDDDEVMGYRIPAGSTVMLSPYVTQRLPDYWESPDRFDPDRFMPGRDGDRPRYAYFPFGGGPRQCIGNNFALMEGTLVLATLAGRFQLRLASGCQVEPYPMATLRPSELLMHPQPRL
jgi:cytochrome P450